MIIDDCSNRFRLFQKSLRFVSAGFEFVTPLSDTVKMVIRVLIAEETMREKALEYASYDIAV